MTRPTARVLALLELLQAGGTWTAGDLAERLAVDERTLRRYIAHLIDLDVPVHASRGRYGGYRLAPGYRMPPLMLTDDEALAVLLGLIAGRRTGAVTSTAEAIDSAVAKVRRVLPTRLASRLNLLLATAEFTAAARPVDPPETETLLRLAEAAGGQHSIEIDYTDRQGRRTARTLHPYGIVAHNGRWYVAGRDAGTGEDRTLRLDRIVRATPGTDSFTVPAGVDPRGAVLDGIASTPWRHDVKVRVRGCSDDVRTRLPRGIGLVDTIDEDWVRLRLRAERLDWVPGVLAGLELPFVIETPDELRDRCRELAQRLLAATEVSGTDQAGPSRPTYHPAGTSVPGTGMTDR